MQVEGDTSHGPILPALAAPTLLASSPATTQHLTLNRGVKARLLAPSRARAQTSRLICGFPSGRDVSPAVDLGWTAAGFLHATRRIAPRFIAASASANSWASVCMSSTVRHAALRRVTTRYDKIGGRRMSAQMELVIESINDAVQEMVRCLGGPKIVGKILWPEKSVEAAARQLADCLNPDRAARLSPEQIVLLFSMSRQAGYHGAKRWFDETTGYVPGEPMEPEDERAKLQRAAIDAISSLSGITARLEKLGAATTLKAVAR